MADTQTPLPEVAWGIQAVTSVLVQANVAIPVIIGTITSIIGIVRALRGTAPPLADILADLERQVASNQARGASEIERLKALAAERPHS